MSPRHHVVITGTGRAGTTFLVELLTHLGLETGFDTNAIESKKYQEARAGLEKKIKRDSCPYVVKSPHFCDYAEDVIHQDHIVIDHIFVPVRNLYAAAESRRYVSKISAEKLPLAQRLKNRIRPISFAGGLWGTKTDEPGKQEEMLLRKMYKLMFALSDADIPVTLMRYPRITKDKKYLFRKLQPVLQDVEFAFFCETFSKVVRPELVHSFNIDDR